MDTDTISKETAHQLSERVTFNRCASIHTISKISLHLYINNTVRIHFDLNTVTIYVFCL